MTLQAAPIGNPRFHEGDAVSQWSGVTLRPGKGHDVVALTGELDIATAPQLSPVIEGLLERGRDRITINLDHVTFIDCYALSVLIAAHHDVARAGGSLDITHNPLCARLLAVTGTLTFVQL